MPNMEVALTCRALPSFKSSPHRVTEQALRPTVTHSFTAPGTPVFGSRFEDIHLDSEIPASGPATVRAKNDVPSRNVIEK